MSGHCPPPGIYQNVPFDAADMEICSMADPRAADRGTYLSWDAISQSRMSLAKRSMLHFKLNTAIDETPAMRRGTLLHTLMFEPVQFGARFAVMPISAFDLRRPNGNPFDSPRGTGIWKAEVDEFKDANPGKKIIEKEDYADALAMINAIRGNARADDLFEISADNRAEVAIVWDDPETGLRCKGRIDFLRSDSHAVDLKSSGNIAQFQTTIAKFAYHRQGAFYSDGLRVLLGNHHDFSIAAVENVKPHSVMAAPLSEDALDAGRDEYRLILRQIADCKRTGEWPSYANPNEWNVPEWAKPNDDVELVIGGKKFRM